MGCRVPGPTNRAVPCSEAGSAISERSHEGRLSAMDNPMSCTGGNVVCLDEQSTSGTTFSIGDVASGTMAGTYYGRRPCPSVADAVSVSSLGTSWDGTSSVSWGGDLEPAPGS